MATPGPLRFMETRARVYRHQWRGSVISTFLNPLMFLAAMGLGLGSLVDGGSQVASLGGVTYLAFLAPGLMAATAMQAAAGDSSWPVMAGIKWLKTYDAALATPVRTSDLVLGHLGFVTVRVAFATVVYGLIATVFGALPLSGALLAVLPAAVTGLAFAAPVMGYTAGLERDTGLVGLFRFGIVPMFLFSGTFFPVRQLPELIRPIAYVTPLWNGVELTRAAGLGMTPAWPEVAHLAVLAVYIVAGTWMATVRFEKRLTT
jgi:lipooligosaccharide transport system permease protein